MAFWVGLNQFEIAHAGVAVAADDQVVVQHQADRGGGLLDVLGQGDIGLRRVGSTEGWLCTAPTSRLWKRFERHPLACAFLQRRPVGGDRLLQARRPAREFVMERTADCPGDQQ